MSSENNYLVMDVGGTNMMAGLVNGQGRVLHHRRLPTKSGRPQAEIIDDMAASLKALAAQAPPDSPPLALALGLPGLIDQAHGLLIEAPNLPGWSQVPLADIMSRKIGLPVHLENDTNLYTLGEWFYGAGRGLTNLLVVTLGTGVGGGLILNRQLWTGSFASAVEIGHIPLAGSEDICGCGRCGCLETVASATGLVRMARRGLAEGHPTAFRGPPDDLNPKVLFDLAKSADPLALAVFNRAGEALGLVLAGVFNLLGLEGVIIGGGVAGAYDFIHPGLWRELSAHLIVTRPDNIRLSRGSLGEVAPLMGGAAWLGQLYPSPPSPRPSPLTLNFFSGGGM